MANIFDKYGKDFSFYIVNYATNTKRNPEPFILYCWDKVKHMTVGEVDKADFLKIKTTLVLIDKSNNKKIIERDNTVRFLHHTHTFS